MKITCLETPSSRYGQYVIVYALAAWPKGTVKSRGWENARVVYEREATEDELAEARCSNRFLCWRYKSWEGVLNDEALYGIDANHVHEQWREERYGTSHSAA